MTRGDDLKTTRAIPNQRGRFQTNEGESKPTRAIQSQGMGIETDEEPTGGGRIDTRRGRTLRYGHHLNIDDDNHFD
jgi:hypothetical protein